MVSNNASKVSTQTKIKESSNGFDDSTKDIPIIELSDDEAVVPVKRKRGSIAASASIPWIYMAQFWHTLKEDGSKHRLK
ncbi:hypothetical protein Tco_0120445, partial [Tanacetum coccineum]